MFRGRLAPFFQSALIVLLTLAAYFPAYSAGFIWDDSDYVANNFSLRTTHGLRQIWADSQASPQYYPLVFTTFWLEWHAWGSRPAGYHLDNVLIHAASAVLLWRLLRRLNAPAAYLAALIFVLHPVQVESVAWVTERKNVLSTFFFICAMLASLVPTHRLSRTRYALAFVLYAASLLAKTVAASFPAVVLLLLWWKRKQVRWRDVLALIPFFVLGLCLSSVTSHLEKTKVGAIGRAWDFSPIDHFLIATRAVWFYAAKLICPANLVFIYPRWDVTSHRFFWMAAGAVLLCVFAALILTNRRLGRGPAAAMICYAGMLVPALGFFHVYPHALFLRRRSFPIPGVAGNDPDARGDPAPWLNAPHAPGVAGICRAGFAGLSYVSACGGISRCHQTLERYCSKQPKFVDDARQSRAGV